jgi:hypothetical protein
LLISLFLLVYLASQRVASVSLRSGAMIDKISFHFTDGSVSAFGVDEGEPQPLFVLQPDEHLVALHVRQGDWWDSVQLETNTGRLSAVYGGDGGAAESFRAETGHAIIGVERASHSCSRISAIHQL